MAFPALVAGHAPKQWNPDKTRVPVAGLVMLKLNVAFICLPSNNNEHVLFNSLSAPRAASAQDLLANAAEACPELVEGTVS